MEAVKCCQMKLESQKRKWKGIEPSRRLFSRHNGFEARDGHQIRVHFRNGNLHHSKESGQQKSPTGACNMPEERGRIQAAAGDFANDVFGRHTMPDLMHMLCSHASRC